MQTDKKITYARYKGINGEKGFKSGKVYKIEKHTFTSQPNFLARLFGKRPEVLAIHTFKAGKGEVKPHNPVQATKMVFTSEETYSFMWHEEHNGYFNNLKK